MKILAFAFSILFAGPLSAQGPSSTSTFDCDNPQILATPIHLIFSKDTWFIQTKTDECLLTLAEKPNPSSNFEDWLFLTTESNEMDCQTQTRFTPPSLRKILQVNLSPALQLLENGFLQITFDNSMAEHGTKAIKTFLKCR